VAAPCLWRPLESYARKDKVRMVSAYPLPRFSRSSPRGLLVVLLMMSVSGTATAECDSPSESNLEQSPILRVGEITVDGRDVYSEE